VQHQNQFGLAAGKLQAQQLSEQLVVAVPLPAVVQRHQEQIRPLQFLQPAGGPIGLQDGVTQGTGQAPQHRGPEQERRDLGRLAGEHVGGQVVRNMPVVAMKGGDELALVLSPAQGQPSQVQPGRPALGPLRQELDILGRQLQPHRGVQQGDGLFVRELQVGDPQLGQLLTGPHPGQGQRGVNPGGQHHMDPDGEVVQEEDQAWWQVGLVIRW
jgi:hypothetical protein